MRAALILFVFLAIQLTLGVAPAQGRCSDCASPDPSRWELHHCPCSGTGMSECLRLTGGAPTLGNAVRIDSFRGGSRRLSVLFLATTFAPRAVPLPTTIAICSDLTTQTFVDLLPPSVAIGQSGPISVTFTIPRNAALRGQTFYCQGFSLPDPPRTRFQPSSLIRFTVR